LRSVLQEDGARADRHPNSCEIICGKCWRRIPASIRARRSALRRRAKKLDRMFMRRGIQHKPGIVTQADTLERQIDRLWARNWEQCKAAAIEAAGGIGG